MLVSVKSVDMYAFCQKQLSSEEIVTTDGSTVDDLIKTMKLAYTYNHVIKVITNNANLDCVPTDDDSLLILSSVIGGV